MKNKEFLIKNGINVAKSLELFGDIEMYNETLIDFNNAIDEKLNNIKKFKELSDMPNYAILVHSLKSDSKYLGFDKLAELSYKHELESKANNLFFVCDKYDELMKEAIKTVNICREYLGFKTTNINLDTTPVLPKDKAILVVDDSNIIRNFIKKIFNENYNIFSAENGNEAKTLIGENIDNLVGILLDLNMPDTNGFEVLEFLKNNFLFNKIPVAIITAEDNEENLEKLKNYPIVDMLIKPFNERDVKNTVEKLINYN